MSDNKEKITLYLKLPVKSFVANWEENGAGAGPMRNRDMSLEADACILLPGGSGTESMERMAREKGLKVFKIGW